MKRECQSRYIIAPSESKALELAIKHPKALAQTYAQAQTMLAKAESKGHRTLQIYAIHYTIQIDAIF